MTTKRTPPSSLFDPRAGLPAVRISPWELKKKASEPPRTNYFSVYWVDQGAGTFAVDAASHAFGPGSLLFFTPYQYLRFLPKSTVLGDVIQFHANFLCVETFHAESGCSGILFNDPYNAPVVELDARTHKEVGGIIANLRREQSERGLGHEEALLAYLKVLLILAARLKAATAASCAPSGGDPRHPVLGELKTLIEAHYCELHSPADYADLLHMTPKTLGRIVREQLGKTLTDLIRERILIHAKWQLLHTLRPVKEIAREVGFSDELYFSRLFKKATGHSPKFFREFETEIRGGSNLSMLSSSAPIQAAGA
jgi:AraC-like DNA-binding protein